MKSRSNSKKRRHYDAEFKSNVLKMNEQGRSVSSLAESFGINENLIYRWKSTAKSSFKQANRSVVEENRQLRRELQEAQQERDILKKALVIFGRP